MKETHAMRRLLAPAIVAGSMIAGALIVPSVVNAQESPAEDPSTTTPEPADGRDYDFEMEHDFETEPDFEVDPDFELHIDFDELFAFDGEIPEEFLNEINADTQALIDALTAAGIPVESNTDSEGFLDFEISGELTDDQIETVEGVFEDLFGDFAEDFTPEELAEFNQETQALIDELAAAGIPVESSTDEHGFLDFEFGELTAEQEEVVSGIFEELFDCPDEDGVDHDQFESDNVGANPSA